MKKATGLATFILLSSFLVFSCATQVEKAPPPEKGTFSLSATNAQLAYYPVTGFAYKSTIIPSDSWAQWAKNAEPIVKGIIDKIPDGYVLQVTGHADSSGPEQPVGNKPGNIVISKDRAVAVYEALRQDGVKSSKMITKGVGSSQPILGVDTRSGKQRRVTFTIVPK
jgi:hypothetical protein